MLRATSSRLARATPRVAAQHYKPSISFPDRKAPKDKHEPHAHPAAPTDISSNFSHFQEVFSSGPHFNPDKIQDISSLAENPRAEGEGVAGSQGKAAKLAEGTVEDLHKLPKRFWDTPSLRWNEDELEAIMTGGASTSKAH
ncbi:hypothetical protein IE81DRAFT_322321 [Ceraceosorus guamensis]|uniref:Ribosomal protein S36, mitochondrial n=1 Tax=Ceraceosorus guamensis TaxID=1522189 RepID=A0A316W748_9BASI|nr:hypothetical protein IE81DRAFT_322321 [Ceraceosorus guamensis]PWN43465.1 hypothetical protein IE81DRAFT_322321 [Ceraceosorus guamensis]